MSTIAIEESVTEVLNRAEISENLLILPAGQLERKLYEKVAKVIELAGGKWNRGKKGFVFSSDPRAKLGLALETGEIVNEKKLRQAFYTPEVVADEVAILAGVAGCRVLEPSAGDGNLVRACVKFGAASVECIELEPACEENLKKIADKVTIGDFLSIPPDPRFDLVVMNPPFNKGQYVKHIEHALKFLAPGGSLISVVPDKDCPKIEKLGGYTVNRFPAGAFEESGTQVSTRVIAIEV